MPINTELRIGNVGNIYGYFNAGATPQEYVCYPVKGYFDRSGLEESLVASRIPLQEKLRLTARKAGYCDDKISYCHFL